MSSGSQCDVQEAENSESSSSNHDKAGNFQPIEDRNKDSDDENISHQMYNDCLSGSNFDEINQTTEGNDRYKIWDGYDGNDEVLHHPNSSSESTSSKKICGKAKKFFVDETQSLAKPSLESPQQSGNLKISADR
ncbi:hypothetical protein PPACK8108_LOCUS23359 [Phakopsora pachyrhizi]|uniref:Uncharacterized protein n=1 Tax=Phakopsora pachyrhizi TaxID=170000 RepID=A0AAV0BM50_PHAPC|nr:hypothetical protein PPACK8108_LOCUS23359 [Phakopsora pachyrhizi]